MRQAYFLPGIWTGTCDVCQERIDVVQLIKVQADSYVYKPLVGYIKVFYSRKMAWICTSCAESHQASTVCINSDLVRTGAFGIPRMVDDESRPRFCSKCKGISQLLDTVKRYRPMPDPAYILIQEEQVCLWCARHLDHFKIQYEGEEA